MLCLLLNLLLLLLTVLVVKRWLRVSGTAESSDIACVDTLHI
jgi:hypothetical protein